MGAAISLDKVGETGESSKKFKLDENHDDTKLENLTSQDAFKDGNSSPAKTFLSEVTGDVFPTCSPKGDKGED